MNSIKTERYALKMCVKMWNLIDDCLDVFIAQGLHESEVKDKVADEMGVDWNFECALCEYVGVMEHVDYEECSLCPLIDLWGGVVGHMFTLPCVQDGSPFQDFSDAMLHSSGESVARDSIKKIVDECDRQLNDYWYALKEMSE